MGYICLSRMCQFLTKINGQIAATRSANTHKSSVRNCDSSRMFPKLTERLNGMKIANRLPKPHGLAPRFLSLEQEDTGSSLCTDPAAVTNTFEGLKIKCRALQSSHGRRTLKAQWKNSLTHTLSEEKPPQPTVTRTHEGRNSCRVTAVSGLRCPKTCVFHLFSPVCVCVFLFARRAVKRARPRRMNFTFWRS